MNEQEKPDQTRRSLLVATTAVGAVAGLGAAVPFVASMWPSERAKAAGAPIEVDLSLIAPGEVKTFEWRGKPVWVIRRTQEMLASLKAGSPIRRRRRPSSRSTPRTSTAPRSPRSW
jgi:ubiquinol-cytochrome c reductase iron-sulfur subunit